MPDGAEISLAEASGASIMKILGVHIGHDSAAAMVVNGKVVADVSEERFNRVKHSAALPVRSIEYCLRQAQTDPAGIDLVALSTLVEFPDVNYLLDLKRPSRLKALKAATRLVRLLTPQRWAQPFPLYMKRFPLPPGTPLLHVEHHLAHAASAYYTSGSREKQLIVSMDGAGDGASAAIWRGEAGKLTCLKRFPENASLGWFYGNVTEALGWRHGGGEGKTMGLAAYGDPRRAKSDLAPFYPKFSAGELVEPHEFGPSSDFNDCGAYHFHFDEANEIHKLVAAHDREHIAAAAQEILTEQAAHLIYPWLEKEKTRYLSCAGGIFLNVKLNQRIQESGKVDFLHIFPNAGDAGLAAGAALYAYYAENPGAPLHPLEDVYWGPEYSNEEIQRTLVSRGLPVRYEEDVARLAARLLAENKTVGWFQGRMESGPRALGDRSILTSPLVAQNKDVLNARVKFREPFRPFCPSISAEAAEMYLQHARLERFMVKSFDVSVSKRAAIPAVVHVDGTVRPQIVEPDANPLYHRLIDEFAALTGESILLNTSFNVQGESIVCAPRDAIRCFFDSGLDCLIMGNYVLAKH